VEAGCLERWKTERGHRQSKEHEMNAFQATPVSMATDVMPPGAEAHLERGRDLARRAVDELIEEIWRRASRHQLDRGVRLSFPFFDDRRLSIRWRDFTVIPRGRILFVPAFVVVAAEREIERVGKDRQLTESTRDHLVGLLERLRQAFVRTER
jgi:hypothetical protein